MLRSWWKRIGLYPRIALSSAAPLVIVLFAFLYGAVSEEVERHREQLKTDSASDLALLTPALTEQAILGDYTAIGALLAALAQRPGVTQVEWTDDSGHRVAAEGVPIDLEAPVWFVRLIDLPREQEQRRSIIVGGVGYGQLTLREDTVRSINGIWHETADELRLALLSLGVILGAVLFVVRQGLRPLQSLADVLMRFGRGDYSVRAPVGGPREIATAISAFNSMAEQIAALLSMLRESESKNRRLAAVVEQTDDAVILRSLRDTILFWNKGAEKLYGFTATDAIGESSRELHQQCLSDDEYAVMLERTRSAQTWSGEGSRITKSGTAIHVAFIHAPMFDEQGRLIGQICTARDISARKRMEDELRQSFSELELKVQQRTAELAAAKVAAEHASRAKGEFLANMSHEVRTPMNGALGMLGMLLKTELTPRQRHLAKTAHKSGLALLKVLNDILDFSKIEAGKVELETIDFSLRERVEDVVQLFAERAYDKDLHIACRIDSDVPDALRGDPGRIRQILSNLIGNALKFTTIGEVRVNVGVTRRDAGGCVLRFEVRDTGIGIDAEAQARIFKPFTQADASTTRRFGGTGLGLTVSRELARLLDGDMGVDSVPGRGSTFWFTARLLYGQALATEAAALDLVAIRLIAAECHAASREVLAEQLAGMGIQAQVVAGGAEALAQLEAAAESEPFQVAVLSVGDEDCLRWARELRSRPRFDPVRLVLISSMAFDITAAQQRELRIDRVLNKPLSEAQLSHTLRELMRAPATRAGERETEAAPLRFEAKVLVVDDYDVNLEIARDLLEEMGCQVDVAEDGRAAVTATLRQRYDLVLMDCQMPEMDGFQATAEIREREADAGVRLPIVALTAHAMRGDRERCIAAGMDDYLSKPFEPEQLQNVLERWLPRAAQRGVQMTAGANGSAQTAAVAPSASALAASTPSTPVLDATALAKLRALQRPGKPSPMQKWGTMFLAGAPDHLRAMQEALERDDAETLQRSAHTLKSGAAQFGAHQFSQQCADIEALAKGGNVADARPKVATLHADYEPVRAALELELERDAADPPPRATSSPPVVVAARWSDLRKTGAKP